MINYLKTILKFPFKLLGKNLSKSVIQLLVSFPYNRVSTRIINLLLNNLDDESIKTKLGFVMHFKLYRALNQFKKAIYYWFS